MSPRTDRKTTDPAARLGVYKRLSDVPDRHRLGSHSEAYARQDPWSDFQGERFATTAKAEDTRDDYRVIDRQWRAHMADIGRHPALADPQHVESFFFDLLDRVTLNTAYLKWSMIEAFYHWLLWNPSHEHIYNPVLMAAAEYPDGASGRVWDRKIGRAKEVTP